MARMQTAPGWGGSGVAGCGMREIRPPGPAPSMARLHEAALAHLARYGTTQAGLIRVLDRRIDRWARAAEAAEPGSVDPEVVAACRRAAREVAARLVASGVIDDAAFAESRARSLTRAGRSRRAVAAHLGARGVDGAVVGQALPDDPEAELAACLALARRRRIGPFRRPEAVADPVREMGMVARAGFDHEVARRALAMELDAAEEVVIRLKRS